MDFAPIFARHANIALQVSMGRDSLACLMLLKPYWDRLTIYWLNTGDAYPETIEVAKWVRGQVPHFVEIDGAQPDVIEHYGYPTDLVPASRTAIGVLVSGAYADVLQDRYSCCQRVMMEPMQARMKADGITLIIRGQRAADELKSPVRSGFVEDGVEYLFPIEDWPTYRVMEYLKQEGTPIPRFYKTMESMPDCMTCSAWWETGAAQYRAQHHPQQHKEVQRRLHVIMFAVERHINQFNGEYHGI